jgi:hypothetical protein
VNTDLVIDVLLMVCVWRMGLPLATMADAKLGSVLVSAGVGLQFEKESRVCCLPNARASLDSPSLQF